MAGLLNPEIGEALVTERLDTLVSLVFTKVFVEPGGFDPLVAGERGDGHPRGSQPAAGASCHTGDARLRPSRD